MKPILYGVSLLVLAVAGSKNEDDPAGGVKTPAVTEYDPPAVHWKEHWFDHVQQLHRVFYDTSVVVYYDSDVRTNIVWPQTYMAQAWNYTKKVYGSFGKDSRLYAVFHSGKYSGGHPSTYMDASHDYHNVTDCGSSDVSAWVSGADNAIDMATHEIGHIVEGAAKGVHHSPAFGIWHDSKWMEIYQYDVYLGLKRKNDAARWHHLKLSTTDDFPRAGTHWYRDWFYPVYTQYGKALVLNKFFTLLARHFPQRTYNNGLQTYPEYSRDMNMGEFVHFWSGAANTDLKPIALKAFGEKDEQGSNWLVQLEKARIDFPGVTYKY